MIKVQLCPPQELEDKYWYFTDVSIFLLFAGFSFLAMTIFLGEIQLQIDSLSAERAQFEQRKVVLQDQLKKFKSLDDDIAYLNKKMEALKSITMSKVLKFRPVVAMEHFQALKPNGLWFRRLALKEDGTFEMKGGSFDNILIAEFSLGLRETQNKTFVTSDIRSLIYFSDIKIIRTAELPAGENVYFDIGKFVDFDLKGKIMERPSNELPPKQMISQVGW